MKKYVAFLRGINVGNIRIKMTDLKLAFEQVECKDVKTYLQTGNVVFNSDKTIEELKTILEKKLSETFDYEAFVLLYEFDILKEIINKYPFERDENHHAYMIFIDKDIILAELQNLTKDIGEEANDITLASNGLYWKVSRGQSTDTVFSKILAKSKYKKNTTVRNINTLEKMIE